MLQGVSFYDGYFTLTDVPQPHVILKLTSLAFQDTYVSITDTNTPNIDLGELMVTASLQELDEVLVTGKSSLVAERADGSLAVQVTGTALATSTSVREILSRSPGIVLDEDNAISILGKGAAVVLVNGVRVTADRLSMLSPQNIERIDIIRNPGPQYDAEGNAVVNIITKQPTQEGILGAIKHAWSYSDFFGHQHRSDATLNYAKGAWSLNSYHGLTTGKDRHLLETTRTRSAADDYFHSALMTDWQYDLNHYSTYGLGTQYNFAPHHYLSIQYAGADEVTGGQLLSNNMIIYYDTGHYTSRVARHEDTHKDNISANYYLPTDTLGAGLFMGFQYAAYQNDFNHAIDQFSTVSDETTQAQLQNVGFNHTDIISLQADYRITLRAPHQLAAGAKFSRSSIRSRTTFLESADNGDQTVLEDLSNTFHYLEQVPAAYINFSGTLKAGLQYTAGLRSEYTDYRLATSVADGREISRHYLNLFPSASLTRQYGADVSLYASYASRIIRAPYDRLNPFVLYQDAFTSIQGNADLQPSRVHALEVGSTYHGWSLKLAYSYVKDPIDGGAFQSADDPRMYILQRTNLDREDRYAITLSRNIHTGAWRSVNTVSTTLSNLIDHSHQFGIDKQRPYYYLYSQNSLDIRHWVTLFVTAWFQSDKLDGVSDEKDLSTINLGLEKKLFHDKLMVQVDFNDILHEVRYDGEYRLGETYIKYYNTMNTNYTRVTVTYNFLGD